MPNLTAISIIIPVYNVERYLSRCLDSVRRQSFSDYEVIVIDDGSTDRTAELAMDYVNKDPRFRLIQQENKGQGEARNTGMDQAQGEYILFVDGDDTIAAGMLQSMYTAATRYNNVQLVFCGTQAVDEQGRKIGSFRENFPSDQILSVKDRKDLILMAPGPVSKLYRRQWVVESFIRFPGGVWYEDLRTTVKLAARVERALYVPEEWYCYYRRNGSTMHNRDLVRNKEILMAFDDLLNEFALQGKRKEFEAELEFLTLYHLYFAASIRVLRMDPHSPLLAELPSYIKREFPFYQSNPYLNRLKPKEKLAFCLLEHRSYQLLWWLYRIADLGKGKSLWS